MHSSSSAFVGALVVSSSVEPRRVGRVVVVVDIGRDDDRIDRQRHRSPIQNPIGVVRCGAVRCGACALGFDPEDDVGRGAEV